MLSCGLVLYAYPVWKLFFKLSLGIGVGFSLLILIVNVAEAEKKKFLDQFLYAEQELAAAKAREQLLQERLLKETTNFQERYRNQIQSNSELEVL